MSRFAGGHVPIFTDEVIQYFNSKKNVIEQLNCREFDKFVYATLAMLTVTFPKNKHTSEWDHNKLLTFKGVFHKLIKISINDDEKRNIYNDYYRMCKGPSFYKSIFILVMCSTEYWREGDVSINFMISKDFLKTCNWGIYNILHELVRCKYFDIYILSKYKWFFSHHKETILQNAHKKLPVLIVFPELLNSLPDMPLQQRIIIDMLLKL